MSLEGREWINSAKGKNWKVSHVLSAKGEQICGRYTAGITKVRIEQRGQDGKVGYWKATSTNGKRPDGVTLVP